jgi:hypothetical protein
LQADTFGHVRAVKNRHVSAEKSIIETFDYRLLLLRGLIIRISSKVIHNGVITLIL